jgi:hypothetical protein
MISWKSNLTTKIIESNPDIPWNWHWVSRNSNLTTEIIEANTDIPWEWKWISRNTNISMKFIKANSDKPWDWGLMSMNPNLTLEIIEANPNKSWIWIDICEYRLKKYIKKEKEKLMYRHKIIQSRLEKRIQQGCKYSLSLIQ